MQPMQQHTRRLGGWVGGWVRGHAAAMGGTLKYRTGRPEGPGHFLHSLAMQGDAGVGAKAQCLASCTQGDPTGAISMWFMV